MPDTINFSFEIRVDGTTLPDSFEHKVARVVVDSCLGLPSMFHIIIDDTYLEFVDKLSFSGSGKFEIGKAVEIKVEDSTKTKVSLIQGLITSIEPEFAEGMRVLVHIRGYDKSIKLTMGKKTRTYLKKTDSDIVKTIIQENGLTCDADSTSVTFDQINQINQTDWEFIKTRADMNGYKIGVKADKFFFKKIDTAVGPELEYGKDLFQFRPRLSALGQFSEINVSGWDVKQKKEITTQYSTGNSPVLSKAGTSFTSPSVTQKIVSSSKEYLAVSSLVSESQAKNLAAARMIDSESRTIQAEGVCFGNPKIMAGLWVNITKVGTNFSGKYLVTQARHDINRGGYTTWFSNHGTVPQTMIGLVSASEDDEQDFDHIYGVVPALVTNNDDKDGGGGRVKLKFPWLPGTGKDKESDWARVSSFNAGAERGVLFMPEVNDEVLVAFEQGDLNRPYVIGSLWNGKDKLPAAHADMIKGGKVCQRIIRSRSGHKIILDDEDGKEKITVIDKSGKNSIIIDSANNSITIQSEKDINITSKQNITFDAQGNVNFKSKGAFGVDAMQAVTVKSKQSVAVQDAGPNKLELGPVGATLQGTTAALKGSAMTEISGGIVKIN
jgi:uncharacterized protein involved in type VI secretion and phage assembly